MIFKIFELRSMAFAINIYFDIYIFHRERSRVELSKSRAAMVPCSSPMGLKNWILPTQQTRAMKRKTEMRKKRGKVKGERIEFCISNFVSPILYLQFCISNFVPPILYLQFCISNFVYPASLKIQGPRSYQFHCLGSS
jgi:hypothetical protein